VHAALFGFSFRHHLSVHAFMGNLEKMNETQIFLLFSPLLKKQQSFPLLIFI
jgi:hypothetical protein